MNTKITNPLDHTTRNIKKEMVDIELIRKIANETGLNIGWGGEWSIDKDNNSYISSLGRSREPNPDGFYEEFYFYRDGEGFYFKIKMVVKGVPDIPNVYFHEIFDIKPSKYAARLDEFIDDLELFLTHFCSRYTSSDYFKNIVIKIKV